MNIYNLYARNPQKFVSQIWTHFGSFSVFEVYTYQAIIFVHVDIK